jgi:O-antigen/teichoic acid export membrane protein
LKKIFKNKFLKNTSIYTVTDVLNKIVPFALLPVLTRYLTPEDYGIIAMFFVLTNILGIITTFETNTAIGVNFFKISKNELKVYIVNVLLLISIVTSVVLLLIIIFHTFLTGIFSIPYKWLIITTVVTLTQFITTINLLLWQSEQNPVSFGIYQITQTIVNLSLSLILIIGFGMGWEGRLIAISFASVLFGAMSFLFLYKRGYLQFKLNRESIEDAIRFGVPLLPHSLSIWFRTGVDRIFLTTLISASATGLYTVGFQIASIVSVLTMAFNKAYVPYLFERLSDITQERKIHLVKYSYLYFLALLLLAGTLSLLVPVFTKFFLGKDFISSQQYVVWLTFGFAFHGMYYIVVNYILYMKKTAQLSYVTFTISILHIILSYALIKHNGALGAAQATATTSFITFLAVWKLSSTVYKMPWFSLKKRDLF